MLSVRIIQNKLWKNTDEYSGFDLWSLWRAEANHKNKKYHYQMLLLDVYDP